MFISLLTVAHIVLAVLLIIVVLLQRSESGMGALGGSNAVFTGQGVSNILTKATRIIAILFIVTSLMLVRVNYQAEKATSVTDKASVMQVEQKALPVEDQEPALPTAK